MYGAAPAPPVPCAWACPTAAARQVCGVRPAGRQGWALRPPPGIITAMEPAHTADEPQAGAAPPIFPGPPFRRSDRSPISVWFTDRPGFVTQLTAPYMLDEAGADFITEAWAQGAAELRLPPDLPLVVLHEWSLMQGYTAEARRRLMAWGRSIRANVSVVEFKLSPAAPVLVRMGASVVASVFSTFRTPVHAHFGESVSGLLAVHELRDRGRRPFGAG